MNEQEVIRLTSLLTAAVKFSNITQREVERKLALSSGSLSRLFSGGIELKVGHVLDVCAAIGLPASCFFYAAYPHHHADKLSPDHARLQRLLMQLHPAMDSQVCEETAVPTPNPLAPDIERLVLAAMSKFFSGMAASAPGNGAPR